MKRLHPYPSNPKSEIKIEELEQYEKIIKLTRDLKARSLHFANIFMSTTCTQTPYPVLSKLLKKGYFWYLSSEYLEI